MPHIRIKLKQNKLIRFRDIKSLSNFQKLAKAYKMGICELVFWALVLKWY